MDILRSNAALLNAAIDWAKWYHHHGIQPVKVPAGTKAPKETGWQKQLYGEAEIATTFAGTVNIGLLLGEFSGDLVCADADSHYAVLLARCFLPETPMVCGRPGKRNAGFFYRCSVNTRRFTDPRKTADGKQERVVELLSTGTQKVVHPSIHPNGELYEWSEIDPSNIPQLDPTDLPVRVERLAAAALLAKYWPGEGVRQDAALALSGAIIRSGVDSAVAEHIVSSAAWAAGDEEWQQRGGCAASTEARLQAGQDVTGFPRAAELFGDDVMRRAVEWLGGGATPATLSIPDSVPEEEPFEPFPVDVFPDPIRSFITEIANTTRTDSCFSALPMLAQLGSLIGNSYRLWINSTWIEPSIIWAATVGESGTLKSPPLDLATSTLERWQSKAFADYQKQKESYETDLALYEKELRCWKGDPQGGDPPERPIAPIPVRYIIEDTTMEALMDVLPEQLRGLLLRRDELAGGFCFNEYKGGSGGDVARWLKIHKARPITNDRKTGTRLTHVPCPFVCVTGTIQPGVLRKALGTDHFENGLAPRLLLAMPPRNQKQYVEPNISDALQRTVDAVLDRMRSLPMNLDENGFPAPTMLPFAPDAKQAWENFVNEWGAESFLLTGDDAAAAAKLECYGARFALILFLTRWACGDPSANGPVDLRAVQDGVRLVRWFSRETKRVYQRLRESPGEQMARAAWRVIEQKGWIITARELYRATRLIKGPDEANRFLDSLVQAGRGVWEQSGKTRRCRVYPPTNSVQGDHAQTA